MEKLNTDPRKYKIYSDPDIPNLYGRVWELNKRYIAETKFIENIWHKCDFSVRGKILDLGCGTGIHMELLKDLGFTVFGLDINLHQLKSAKEMYPNLNSVLYNANMTKIPFQSNCFELVTYMSESINYLYKDEVKDSLKEAYRCLKQGGAIVIVSKWAKNLGGRGLEESYKNNIRYSKHWITRADVPAMNPDEAIWNAEFEDLKTGYKQSESHYFPFMNPFNIAKIATKLGFVNTEVLDIHSIYGTKIPLLKESSERTAIIIALVNKI